MIFHMLIAQITDSHIVEKGQHWLSDPATATQERLARVVAYVNALTPQPDVVLMTGDVTEEGTEGSYRHCRELVDTLKAPLFVIPGNHDRRQQMRTAFSNHLYMPTQGYIHYAIEGFPLRLIALDTLVEGEDYGCICEERLAWVKETLCQDVQKPTIIFMHHPPVKTGNKLFDGIICFAHPGFEQLIRDTPNVIGIFTGHYHHLCVTTYGGKPCFLAPSIAPVHYFVNPQQDDLPTAVQLDDPAVTLHRWHEGNVIISHVNLVKDNYDRRPIY